MVFFILVRLVISLVILTILAVTAIALRVVPDKPQYQHVSKENASPSAAMGFSVRGQTDEVENGSTFQSHDGSFQFQYPSEWKIMNTPAGDNRNAFGTVLQSWTVQNNTVSDSTQTSERNSGEKSMPENSVEIEFVISSNERNYSLEQLVDCNQKTVTCENVRIKNTIYKKASTIRNDGMMSITLTTKNGDQIIRARVLISAGEQQDELHDLVLQIFQTFQIVI